MAEREIDINKSDMEDSHKSCVPERTKIHSIDEDTTCVHPNRERD